MCGAELYAEAAGFTALHNNFYMSFCHLIPQTGSNDHSECRL